jgi:hypothetical protein
MCVLGDSVTEYPNCSEKSRQDVVPVVSTATLTEFFMIQLIIFQFVTGDGEVVLLRYRRKALEETERRPVARKSDVPGHVNKSSSFPAWAPPRGKPSTSAARSMGTATRS